MLAWERQPGEGARAYEAFCAYRDLGADRSVTKVARMLDKSRTLIGRWSSEHDWVDRVAALEARDQMIQREAVREHVAERADEHARRESALRERALEIREKAAEKALRIVSSPLYKQERVLDMDGEDVTIVMTPAGWNQGTAVSLFALSQNNAGSTAEETEVVGEMDYSALTDEELALLIELDGKVQVRSPDPGHRRGRP